MAIPSTSFTSKPGFPYPRESCKCIRRFVKLLGKYPEAVGPSFRFVGQLNQHRLGLCIDVDDANRQEKDAVLLVKSDSRLNTLIMPERRWNSSPFTP